MAAKLGARQRLADLMERRRAELRLTWKEVAARASTSEATLRRVRKEHNIAITIDTATAIEDGLHWARGSVSAILAGGEPTVAGPTAIRDEPDLRDDVERKLWAITDLPEDDRWEYIYQHRARKQRRSATSFG